MSVPMEMFLVTLISPVVPSGMSTSQDPAVWVDGSGYVGSELSQSAITLPEPSSHSIVMSDVLILLVMALAWTASTIPTQSRNRGTPGATSYSPEVVAYRALPGRRSIRV